MQKLRQLVGPSPYIVLIPESNLGFEAQHIVQAVSRAHLPRWVAVTEAAGGGIGFLTTNDTKAAMCKATQEALAFGSISFAENMVSISQTPESARAQLLAEMRSYLMIKEERSIFSKPRVTFSGKAGGQQDDLIVALQLCIIGTNVFMRSDKYTAYKPAQIF